MIKTTLSDFRKNLEKYLVNVAQDFETLIISRGKNSGVVIMSLEEYNSLDTTQHELSSKKMRKDSTLPSPKFELVNPFQNP